MLFDDNYFMKKALDLANQAFEEDEVPIGALIVCNNKIIAKSYNQTEKLKDVTAHAEILSITSASNYIGSKYLNDCSLYVTLEPCNMCAGALYWSQIGRIIIGARDFKRGFINNNVKLHPKTQISEGILNNECSEIIKSFFELKR